MTRKENIRDFAPIESRALTIEKPQITTGTPVPLLEWLAKIIRRMVQASQPRAKV